MKFSAAYYLCLLYLTVAFKPLVPIVQDAWAHQFNEAEHLATVHAHFGSHHLQKEMADRDSDNNDHGKSGNTLKPADDVPFHTLMQTVKYDFAMAHVAQQFRCVIKYKLPLTTISYQAPPPKFS